VPGRGRGGSAGVTVHRTRSLHPEDRALRDGIPVTSVARTLLDYAEVVYPPRLARAFEEADRLRLVDMKALERLMARSHGRHGLVPLQALVSEAWRPLPETRSELERVFLELCRDAGLPAPQANVMLAGLEVDALWPRERLVVELDGFAFHRTRAAFERDRRRDAALQLAGYRVLRLTARRLAEEPAAVVGLVRSLLPGGFDAPVALTDLEGRRERP